MGAASVSTPSADEICAASAHAVQEKATSHKTIGANPRYEHENQLSPRFPNAATGLTRVL